MTVQISVPHTGDTPKTLAADPSKLPENVRQRLIEIALQGRVRSGVNNAVNLEYDKALADATKAHDEAQKAAKTKDKNYKPTKFDEKAFRKSFVSKVDPMATAASVLAELESGKIRVRGTSQSDKLLSRAVKNNIVMALVGKGKKQRDANTMVGDDPFAFLDRTARKRAGEDEAVYKTELAKLNAQYVDPARTLLAPDEPEDADEGEETAEGASAADDLV